MHLLTDGSEKSPILKFCLRVISQHSENWPPSEDILARDFVNWFGLSSILTKDGMKELCQARGVTLSFVLLPQEIRGFNCSFYEKKEIVISERELAPFSHSHTLLDEFRELLEHEFVQLGHATIGAKDLEAQPEIFAMSCRIEAATREVPSFFEIAQNVEKKWQRYLASFFLIVFGVAYVFSCVYLPQMEEVVAESKRQRYIRT
jgi:hypothetical protein